MKSHFVMIRSKTFGEDKSFRLMGMLTAFINFSTEIKNHIMCKLPNTLTLQPHL